jgi:TPR repeat protein
MDMRRSFGRTAAALLLAASVASCDAFETEPQAPLEQAIAAHERGDYATALAMFRELSGQGVVPAMFSLGFMYANGQGVPQNYSDAARWFREAADRGGVRAQYALGELYQSGLGVPQDDAEALRWYSLAAQQGMQPAQEKLAAAAQAGITPEAPPAVLEETAQAETPEPELAAVPEPEPTPPPPPPPAPPPPADVTELAIVSEPTPPANATIENAVAAYDRGDFAAAEQIYRQLAGQGDARAQYRLAAMYASGLGVALNTGEAVRLFRLAAEQGDAAAQYELGTMYANGQGVPQSDADAMEWYSRAALQGHPAAQSGLDEISARMNGGTAN